jgi:hypothetical protein
MKIALDYDNTITRDPYLWQQFVKLAKDRGHSVTIVTSRDPGSPIADYIVDVPVIYCSFTAKRRHYPEGEIWIDDDPKRIDLDHGTII